MSLSPRVPTAQVHVATDYDIDFVLELTRALHEAGTPAHRLETAMSEVSRRIGIDCQFFSTPTFILVAFGKPGQQKTALLRVEPGAIGLEQLQGLDAMVSAVIAGASAESAVARIRVLAATPERWGAGVTVLAHALASATAARFFRGGWREIATAAAIGATVGVLTLQGRRSQSVQRVLEPAAALAAVVLATAAGLLIGRISPFIATVAGVLSLLPGLSLTTAMSELATRHPGPVHKQHSCSAGPFCCLLGRQARERVRLAATLVHNNPIGLFLHEPLA